MTEELPHIRCHTCGKVIANLYSSYQNKLSEGKTVGESLDEIGLKRICCRMRMMNPFKISSRPPTFETHGLSTTYDDLSDLLEVDPKVDELAGSLNAMKLSSGVIIVPEEEKPTDIKTPFISLPPISGPGGKVLSKKPDKIEKWYDAI